MEIDTTLGIGRGMQLVQLRRLRTAKPRAASGEAATEIAVQFTPSHLPGHQWNLRLDTHVESFAGWLIGLGDLDGQPILYR